MCIHCLWIAVFPPCPGWEGEKGRLLCLTIYHVPRNGILYMGSIPAVKAAPVYYLSACEFFSVLLTENHTHTHTHTHTHACTCAQSLHLWLTLWPYGLQPIRLPYPWDFPGKPSRLPWPPPGDLPNPGTKPHLLRILHCRRHRDASSIFPEKSHEQRSLAGYSPWGHKSWTWQSN